MAFLVLFDTDRIQEFVFATRKLRAIRGGSFLLEDLNRRTADLIKVHGGKGIYVGGGAGAAEFSELDKAKSFCGALEKRYRDETLIASLTTWIEPRKSVAEAFPDWVARGERGLRRCKEAKMRVVPHIVNPYAKVCDLCGRLPAAVHHKEGYLCQACLIQWDNGVRYKHTAIYRAIETKAGDITLEWPKDLEEIGAAGDPPGYIGLIYSDGNRMGRRRQELLAKAGPEKAEAVYARFSTCVDQATRQAMVEAVLACLGVPENGKTYPVQFFITGGDDMLAAVPAAQAVPIALKFGELFREYYKNGRNGENGSPPFPGLDEPASVAIGVALAKQNYPLHSLIHTAHELQQSAKQLAWEKRAEDVSVIDFLATSSSLLQPIQKQRQELHYDKLWLTQRPYTIDNAALLVGLIQNLKASGFPRNKLNSLWRPLFKGRLAACLDYLVLLSRLSDQGSPSPRQALLRIAETLRLSPFPWRLDNTLGYRTPMLDLAELYDFIPG